MYAKKVKNAQEAHEAIRPAGDTFRLPAEVAGEVPQSEARVYELIWKRTIASQMTDAVGETVSLRLGATSNEGRDVEFSASGTVITHQGFRRVYIEDTDAGDAGGDDAERRLPPLGEGDAARGTGLDAEGHETQPPARYTEASLVKRLEELGSAGRRRTLDHRDDPEPRLCVEEGFGARAVLHRLPVVNLMEGHFPNLVDYAFTARMEDDLDKIAGGSEEPIPWLTRFYFGEHDGGGEPGLKGEGVGASRRHRRPSGEHDPAGHWPTTANRSSHGSAATAPMSSRGDSEEAADNETALDPR